MTPETNRRLAALSTQLIDTLMTAALCAEEIRDTVRTTVDDPQHSRGVHENRRATIPTGNKRAHQRPLLDESTMRVLWNGKSVHLGHTLCFRILERLSRRPGQYVTHLDLMREVWENEDLELATVRSVVRNLRGKLRDGGMSDLADAIRGHNGRYILDQ